MAANVRIYGHRYAGRQAIKLFEELAALQTSYNGEVYIRRTLDKKRDPGDRQYPPVYEIYYKPNFWNQIDRQIATMLFDIGDKYQCQVRFSVEDGHAVAVFRDDDPNRGV